MNLDFKGFALVILASVGTPVIFAMVLLCGPETAFGVDSLDLSWNLEYTTSSWSKPGDGTGGATVERTGYSVNLDETGSSSGSVSHYNTYYHYANGQVSYTSQSADQTKETYRLDVIGPIIGSKGYFSTVGWVSDSSSRAMRYVVYANFDSPLDVKGSSLSWSLPGYVCALLEKNSNYYVSPVSGWETYVKYWGGDWQYVSDSIDTSQKISGISFTSVLTLETGGQHVGGTYYLGLPVSPKIFVGDQVVEAIEQQTSDLSNTDGSSDVASNVMTNFSQDQFNTKLGAVSQVVDISTSLFTAISESSESEGIDWPGYSIDLPLGGTISTEAQTINLWQLFPDIEVPVRTAVTLMLVLKWFTGIRHWYESLVAPEIASLKEDDDT